jgi:hypothetical protein
MMREIKFRGKRVDNGEWVCGGIYTSNNEFWIITDAWKTIMAGRTIDHTAQSFKVIPETVGQFIGSNDKNDKDIYRGDAAKHIDSFGQRTGIIIWDEKMMCWAIDFGESRLYGDYTLFENLEVIGNTIDNPDLLVPHAR